MTQEAKDEKRRLIVVGPELLRDALGALFGRYPEVDVVGACAPEDAVAMVRGTSPDIVVMELAARPAEELAVLRALTKLEPPPSVVVLANHCPREKIALAIEAGAAACVAPEDGTAAMLAAINAIRGRRRYMGAAIADLMVRGGPLSPAAEETAGSAEKLTERERQVLQLIAQGRTDREIASQLGLSPRTVHTHRTSIMSKLRVHNAIALVLRAIKLGLVDTSALAYLATRFFHGAFGRGLG